MNQPSVSEMPASVLTLTRVFNAPRAVVFKAWTEPERLVFVNSFSDTDGELTRHPMSPTWPLEIHNTLTLSEENGKTTLSLRGGPVNASEVERQTYAAGRTGLQQGMAGSFAQLDAYLETLK